MWHKAEWMKHPMRLELTREVLLGLAHHYTTQGAEQRCRAGSVSNLKDVWQTKLNLVIKIVLGILNASVSDRLLKLSHDDPFQDLKGWPVCNYMHRRQPEGRVPG